MQNKAQFQKFTSGAAGPNTEPPVGAVGRWRLLGGALGSRDRTSWARQGPGLGPYSLAPPVEANLEHQWHRGLQALDTARP